MFFFSCKQKSVGSTSNLSQNANPSESWSETVLQRRRRSSSGGSKAKIPTLSNSDTKADRSRKQSQGEDSGSVQGPTPSGSKHKLQDLVKDNSETATFVRNSSHNSTLKTASRSRRKSAPSPSRHSFPSETDLSASIVSNSSSKSSVTSSKTRSSSGSSLTSVSSESLLGGNCEKCRLVKKGGRSKGSDLKVKSTQNWSVSVDIHTIDSASKIQVERPSVILPLSEEVNRRSRENSVGIGIVNSKKQSLRPSTQAQSKAEVGTYRVSRKRSNTTKSSSSSTLSGPAAKCSKVESNTDSDFKSETKKEPSVVNQGIHEQALPPSFLIAGTSYSKDLYPQPPKKKAKLEKKLKKKDKKSQREDSPKGATGSSPSKSSAPELNSLRRHTRAKKTGSCASSRCVSLRNQRI